MAAQTYDIDYGDQEDQGGQPRKRVTAQDYFPRGYQFPTSSDQRAPTEYGTSVQDNFLPGDRAPMTPQPAPAASSPFNYESARDSWMSGQYGVGKDAAARWAAEHGIDYNGSDTINLPNGGGYIDIIGNYAGGAGNGRPMTNTWTPAGGNGPNANGMGGGGGAFNTMTGAGGGAGGGGGAFSDADSRELFNLLMGRAKQGLNVSADDPLIKAQTDAFRAEQDRQTRDYLSGAAERGGYLGNLSAEERSAHERAGQATGAFQAKAMQQEMMARRQEISDALAGAAGFLTAQQQQALTRELHLLDNALQESQFGRSLGQRAYEYDTGRFDTLFG